jgi:hypothetical protein
MRVRAASRRLDLERQSLFGRSVRKPGLAANDEMNLSN